MRPASETNESPQAFWLKNLGHANGYNRWVFEQTNAHLGRKVLEVGCGTGTFTSLLAASGRHVVALDIEPDFVAETRRATADMPNVEARVGDIMTEALPAEFDSIFMLDVLEHIEDDLKILQMLKSSLISGGQIVLKVPAFPSLYGPMDQSIGHFRRYSKRSLEQVLLKAGFASSQFWYFNCAGMLGWWLNGKLLQRQTPPASQVELFERVLPLVRAVDFFARPFAGLSIFAVARAP